MSEPEELFTAVAEGDLEAVVRLLGDEGASPLAVREDRTSLARAAHRHLDDGAQGRAVFQRVRRAAEEAVERSERLAGLAGIPGPRLGRGLADLRATVGASGALDLVCAECEVKTAARALATLVQSPRREADVASRPVADAARLAFVYRLRPSAWSIVPLVLEAGSPWSVPHVRELAARGEGVGPIAKALAETAGCRTMHVELDTVTEYAPDGAVQRRTFEPEEWWAPDGPLPTAEEAAAALPGRADDPALPEAAARRRERLRRMDEALAGLGVDVPSMRIRTNGWDVQLELGLDAAQVARADLVVLQELGDPAVDRSLGQAPPAPALVAPGGEAPLAHAPPSIVSAPEPDRSEGEAMAHEPPPIVDAPAVVAEPAVADGPKEPPLVREPPPMVDPSEVPPNEPPAPAPRDEPEAPDDPEAPDAPAPPVRGGTAEPPMVSEPPPIVNPSEVTNPEAPESDAGEAPAED